jgi:DNA-binding GntR family transcriptional regulator
MSGSWPAGQRLDSARLAENLGVSISPVRDSLNRLVGERMVERAAGGGFLVPRFSEQDLKGLFAFSFFLLHLAIIHSVPGTTESFEPIADTAARTTRLFERLADRSSNHEVRAAIGSLNDRLCAARQSDAAIFSDADAEIEGIERIALLQAQTPEELVRGLARHHQRRIDKTEHFIRYLEQGLP